MKLSALILIVLLAGSVVCVRAEMSADAKAFLARKPNPGTDSDGAVDGAQGQVTLDVTVEMLYVVGFEGIRE